MSGLSDEDIRKFKESMVAKAAEVDDASKRMIEESMAGLSRRQMFNLMTLFTLSADHYQSATKTPATKESIEEAEKKLERIGEAIAVMIKLEVAYKKIEKTKEEIKKTKEETMKLLAEEKDPARARQLGEEIAEMNQALERDMSAHASQARLEKDEDADSGGDVVAGPGASGTDGDSTVGMEPRS
ncbi:hypothetical protein CPLU01_12471 [Colletotrichum plurivorum]|uniref:Uncharacterized protein n=1 Tax=Colletotrichum plurivorum TaxID=2175906 RepID=A0A8H6JY64_9PEZI|nr:hypothetical protein CPLU01_12471 [Colletotrichum plurivorum]